MGRKTFAGSIQKNANGEPQTATVITLLVTPEEAEKLTLAAEYDTQTDVMNGWLGQLGYKFSDKFSTIFRISGVEWDGGGSDTKYTVAPTYTINDNFAMRAEFSIGEGDSGDYTFAGGQIVFKF